MSPRAALKRWWLARQPRTDTRQLTQRNVYIVPTRAGFAFAATSLLLLLASINYQLNLGYALTFLLAGSAAASMHMTHAALRGLVLHLKPVAPAYAGGQCELELVVTNTGAVRHGLGFATDDGSGNLQLAYAEVAAASQTTVRIGCLAGARGVHPVPPLRIESRFPFGLFRAWTVWCPTGERWVYPQPETPAADLPAPQALDADARQIVAADGSEFDSVRSYRRGDTPRQIVWKKAARSGELVSRDTRAGTQRELRLSWTATASLADPEARLERLAAWVLAAELAHLAYGLHLPGAELPPGGGAAHQTEAMRLLATWG